jgi:hypothetical protein
VDHVKDIEEAFLLNKAIEEQVPREPVDGYATQVVEVWVAEESGTSDGWKAREKEESLIHCKFPALG